MSEAIIEHNVHVRVLDVHILRPNVHVSVLKITDIILSLVSSKKLDWTHTFGTHCIFTNIIKSLLLVVSLKLVRTWYRPVAIFIGYFVKTYVCCDSIFYINTYNN